jgi:hypothetical protein
VKVHLSAICGTAMASLAGLLRERGHEVTGSDQDVYPPMSTQLETLGIPIRTPYAEENVPASADLVVIGNALSRGNPEVEAVLDRRQRFTSLPALVAEELLRPRRPLVVAGTHGKTTTASLLAFLLRGAGRDPSFLIGGVPVDFDRSYRLGAGDHFVIEGDEYDCAFFDKRPKFVHYLPEVAIIGNVEFDHADIYRDLEAVQTAFLRLLNVVPRRGLLIAGTESPALAEILPKARCRVETFGLDAAADWCAADVRAEAGGTRFRLLVRGRERESTRRPPAPCWRASAGSGDVWSCGRGWAAWRSTTTSRTTPPPSGRRFGRSESRWKRLRPRREGRGRQVEEAASWPSSNPAPIPPGRGSSRTPSVRPWPWPTASSCRRRTFRAGCHRSRGSRRTRSSPAPAPPAPRISSPPWRGSSECSARRSAPGTTSPSSRTGASAGSTPS